jgi:hypothetical protein
MIIAQVVNTLTSKFIPTTSPALLQGTAVTRTGALVTSTAGAATMLGIAQCDMPAFITGPQTNGIQYNQSRMLPIALEGRLALRVQAGQWAGITAGASFGLVNGEAVVVGVSSTVAAVTLSGANMVVDEKVIGADGVGYILVFVY